MRSYVDLSQKNRVQLLALVLLAVALVIPQLAWADHASDHPYSQFDDPATESVDADTARWVALGKYYEGKSERAAAADGARWFARGNFYLAESERAAAADSARWASLAATYTGAIGDAALLAANPEGGADGSASLAALGSTFHEASGNAFLAVNPEAVAYLRFAARAGRETDAAGFLAANPEAGAYVRWVGQEGCSVGVGC
jgi:hypothetical protein